MSIHPSTIKQLLQLQMLRSLDTGTGAAGGASSEFSALLEELLLNHNQIQADEKTVQPSELLARRNWAAAVQPNSITEWNGRGPGGQPSDYDTLIAETSARHGVDPSLVKAVIQAESGFNSKAVSHAGAKGLMQLMDKTAQGLGVTNSFDPQQNVDGGTRFLGQLLRKYNGHEGVALAAYNAGPGRVDRLGIRTDGDLREKLHLLPKETQNYVGKVLGFRQQAQITV